MRGGGGAEGREGGGAGRVSGVGGEGGGVDAVDGGEGGGVSFYGNYGTWMGSGMDALRFGGKGSSKVHLAGGNIDIRVSYGNGPSAGIWKSNPVEPNPLS